MTNPVNVEVLRKVKRPTHLNDAVSSQTPNIFALQTIPSVSELAPEQGAVNAGATNPTSRAICSSVIGRNIANAHAEKTSAAKAYEYQARTCLRDGDHDAKPDFSDIEWRLPEVIWALDAVRSCRKEISEEADSLKRESGGGPPHFGRLGSLCALQPYHM